MTRFPLVLVFVLFATASSPAADRPNIFIAISDDVSFPHASAHGSKMVNTPAFDRVAADGVLFSGAFCPAPGCSPSRAAFLTGRHIWMIEEAGTHASYFQKKYQTFPEALQESGYFVGATGKAWSPGDYRHNGRELNPAGKRYGEKKSGYVGGFKKFMS
ncbi:MAG TPA: heparan N-sulfatase, partial [Fuerstia sp.]|nr:heparan N-sulfatase [Fuerstiella sp.]